MNDFAIKRDYVTSDSEIVWMMSDGSTVTLSELDNHYLLNAIRLLEQQDKGDSLICLNMHAEARKRGIWSRDK